MSSDALVPNQLWQELLQHDLPGWEVRCYQRHRSTMEAARELLAEHPELQSGVVLTAQQSDGRGRQGRTWLAAERGLYVTFLLTTEREARHLMGLSLVVGCVLHDVLTQLGCQVQLKWPNDVLARDGSKLSGTLIELLTTPRGSCALIGVGVNISGAPARVPGSVSMQDLCGKTFAQTDLAVWLAKPLLEAWQCFCEQGFARFQGAWEEKAFGVGEPIVLDSGASKIHGTLRGVDARGCLRVATSSGEETFAAGDVRIVREGNVAST